MLNQHILLVEEGVPAAQIKYLVLRHPEVEPQHAVFSGTMLEDNSAHQHRSLLDWVASVFVHVAILATLLILPLYFTSGLDIHKFNLTFLSPPTLPPGPPPAPLVAAVPHATRVPIHPYIPGKLTAPSFIPRQVTVLTGEAGMPETDMGGVPGGVPGGQIGGTEGGVLGSILKGIPAPPPVPPPAVVAERPKVPVMVGGDVKPPKLLFAPEPEYPILAKQSHISGVVVIEAIIDEHGNVIGMHALSGQPLLIPSALEAVAKRKYEPTILDGTPTPIDLRVEVSFKFS